VAPVGWDHRAGDEGASLGEDWDVIRNVRIHVANEQPLLADLYGMPNASDAGMVCTNVRSMDGKRPLFIDHIDSTFFFPYRVIRFIEIPRGEAGRQAQEAGGSPVIMTGDGVLEGSDGSLLPVALAAPDETRADAESDADLEIDEDFLQRIRDI
jgi:hypothetical protein